MSKGLILKYSNGAFRFVRLSEQYEHKYKIIPLTKANFSKIREGMILYEDNTCSFERVADKKIKAIVELVENGVVYGDLTVSELFEIEEQRMNWYEAKKYIEQFSYPCKENEKIVWYDIDQLEKVYRTYDLVRIAFKPLRKSTRYNFNFYWSSTEHSELGAWGLYFSCGGDTSMNKNNYHYVRPVLSIDTRYLV